MSPFLFSVENRSVGFVEFYQVSAIEFRICRVFISPKFRGQNLAQRMLELLIEKAKVEFNGKSLLDCDAVIMGSPTYMGDVSAQFKAFADASSEYWAEQLWADKVAAGFTCGSALNGDQSNSLQYLSTLASQHGMYWVGLDTAQDI